MRTKVQKWGNSLAVRIPKPFADEIGLEADTAVEVSLEEGKLVVGRPEDYAVSLEELLEGVTPNNIHREIESGPAVGD
ncbi:MAG: AbrB/MazE/SpoVT family DNA-binding domain-containing protein, partial [Anaerolineales bacterium]|nr:AbrB/MazE/SpoVT family DNA-binding domain-containing protein [Anaerolineales bacterium]